MESFLDNTASANGGAIATLVAAGAGCAAMGVLYAAATAFPTLAKRLTWYAPSGALSGMAVLSVLVWLATWLGLTWVWSSREVPTVKPLGVALALLACGVLLTFPPFVRLF